MRDAFDDPFGLGLARHRLSEEQTVERMIEAGARLVGESGLRISFDLLRLEEVISEAGVSRTAVYKRWPRKEQYYADLLLRLAGDAHPVTAAYDTGTPDAVIKVAEEHSDWFGTAAGRHRLFIEMCRLGAHQNYEALVERPDWRVYMTLHAAYLTLPGGEFKDSLRVALEKSEARFRDTMAEFYKVILALIGYRLRPGVADEEIRQFVLLGGAAVEGVVLTSGVNEDLRERRFLMDPFGVNELQDWSHAAFLFTSLAVACAEPDPDEVWTDARVAAAPMMVARMKEQLSAMD